MSIPFRYGIISAVVAALALPVTATAAQADDPGLSDDVIVVDNDSGEVLIPSVQALVAPDAATGYAYQQLGLPLSNNYGEYTLYLVSSTSVESLRTILQTSLDDISSSYASSISLSSTTVSEVPSSIEAGNIYLQMDGIDSCGSITAGSWAGCASIEVTSNTAGTSYTGVGGQVWIASLALSYTTSQKQHLLTHEISHVLGLAHYDSLYNGEYQAMHSSNYSASTLRSGDKNGLQPLYQSSVVIQDHVKAIYADLLERSADSSGLSTWAESMIVNGTAAAVRTLMTSTEYRTRVIEAAYQEILGRAADTSGLTTHLSYLASDGTEQSLKARLWASTEAYNNAGQDTSTWVTQVYETVLERTPSSSEVAEQVQNVATSGRTTVAQNILLSEEYGNLYLNQQYQLLLGRDVDSSGIASWRQLVQTGQAPEVAVNLIASAEYRARAVTRFGYPE